ncbi:phosphoribosylformylglycinamidine cyclo-ligase [Ehrlichia chaffeensis str. Arkansas]|uniref:Phosphoribosylformylglycinamidine cyclo-ligase n=1 Tax=Ehrlichia chaffeensis (strain ATCC CRL-10679 / Arkansas) TaxID=205920 RepID=Q2GHC1_EHRCR|nr:phosphoribosylformylglycinamidine cyclo-ligase [Ehrlichia chaffeensis]ABD44786.1 phosphoribosylformylglycinamidine cyclo-ligase [Ehrlichia chaffeensis str. Arkansas]AHX08048.1 phosphoribosylformylglycinamidine cyclo-ligase [Ehrlichia chaffeensis str. Osceola]AHX08488.1 phosphoribosylformylglycinamidine cyclo-ligase [Ehrlichia chaffeensis str. Saint Vincent]AHX09287.1 phosphoribosylformylglycinamidine cyclo-ligase [Ehrlichia chaffeensis str. Wakulla]
MKTYSSAGVNIESGNSLVEKIKPIASSTSIPGVVDSIGSFGALFDISRIKEYNKPVLVSSTDGVGTKLCIAQGVDNHKTIGIDLVAMCVNDVLAQGAEPLFFLDYFATGKVNHDTALEIINSIAVGCKKANVALIGGETAEMPGMYSDNKYDLAGFAVGIIEADNILPKSHNIKVGDKILGLASSGLHSNGFSLIRKIISDNKINYHDVCPWSNQTWANYLLTPTRIYVKSLLSTIPLVNGLAHITGGGFTYNIPRIIPSHLSATIDLSSWKMPEIFHWLNTEVQIQQTELLKTFNCGIGMILVTSQENEDQVLSLLKVTDEVVYKIGEITERNTEDQVIFK